MDNIFVNCARNVDNTKYIEHCNTAAIKMEKNSLFHLHYTLTNEMCGFFFFLFKFESSTVHYKTHSLYKQYVDMLLIMFIRIVLLSYIQNQ